MKCRSFTAIVLAVAMLVSFGLCNLSVAANSTSKHFEESGTVYNNAMGVHTQLGTYHNWLEEVSTPFAIKFYGETYPAPGYSGQVTYRTFYEVKVVDEYGNVVETHTITVRDSVIASSTNGYPATTDQYEEGIIDGHSGYSDLEPLNPNLAFYARFTNEVYSANNEYYGSRTGTAMFSFDSAGNLE